MLKSKILIAIFFQLIFWSCNSQVKKYNQDNIQNFYDNINKVKANSLEYYTIRNMYSHYPEKFSLDSVESHIALFSYLPIEKHNSMIEYSCLILKDKKPALIDSALYDKYFELNLNFNCDTFCKMIDINAINKGLFPIPDINDILYLSDSKFKFFNIEFFESNYGNYWKIQNKYNRPNCLGKWKNGYSRGIGVYKDSTGWKKMYWVMYW